MAVLPSFVFNASTHRYEGPLLLGFLNMLIATVGSGALAPMILRDPLPFFNDDRLITLVLLFFLFAIRFDPYIVRIIKTVRVSLQQPSRDRRKRCLAHG